ncbi:MAG: hypothetical protein WB817_12470 [Terriglobales bacterium]
MKATNMGIASNTMRNADVPVIALEVVSCVTRSAPADVIGPSTQ